MPTIPRLTRWLILFLAWVIGAVPLGTVAASENRAIRIVALGDSTTYGYSVEDNYPRQLARQLFEHGIHASVINSGVNGDTTAGAQQRFERDVLQHRPNLVIIQFGLNDQTVRLYQRPEDISSYVSRKKFESNLRQFVVELRLRGTNVILMTPNPMCWTPTLERHHPEGPYLDPPRGGNLLLQEYAEIVRRAARAEEVPLVDIYQSYSDFEKSSGRSMHELFLDDGVHPNERGYKMNVNRIMRQIHLVLEHDATVPQTGLTAARSAPHCTRSAARIEFTEHSHLWRGACHPCRMRCVKK